MHTFMSDIVFVGSLTSLLENTNDETEKQRFTNAPMQIPRKILRYRPNVHWIKKKKNKRISGNRLRMSLIENHDEQ